MSIDVVTFIDRPCSWTKVAKALVKYLRRDGIDARLVEMSRIPTKNHGRIAWLAPAEWVAINHPMELRKILKTYEWVAGWVSMDSTEPGYVAAWVAKMMDLVAVTGAFALDTWSKYVDYDRLAVVHLGIDPETFTVERFNDTNAPRRLKPVATLPHPRILVFAAHDAIRKNLDIVLETLRDIDTSIVVRTSPVTRKVVEMHLAKPFAEVSGYLSDLEMVALYDLVDLVVIPSGAGSCELPAVEALARGVPVITSTWHSFSEYLPWSVAVPCSEWVDVSLDIPWVLATRGKTCRIKPDILKTVIETVLSDLENFKRVAEARSKEVIEAWSMDRIVREEVIPVLEAKGWI